jgi:Mg/Co/Ni transporter MgtE
MKFISVSGLVPIVQGQSVKHSAVSVAVFVTAVTDVWSTVRKAFFSVTTLLTPMSLTWSTARAVVSA